MTYFVYIEIDIFAVMVLATIYDYSKWKYLNLEQRLFNLAILSTGGVVVADAFSWIFNGIETPIGVGFNVFFNYLYWILSIFPGYFAMLYSLKKVGHPRYKLHSKLGAGLTVIATLLLITNRWTNWIFTFDQYNLYVRGPFFGLVGFLPFAYIGVAVIATLCKLIQAPKYEKKEHGMFLFFMSVAFFGSLPQIFFYGITTIWISVALDLLMCYVYLQRGNVSTDSLTRINNRRRFDAYAKYVCDHVSNEKDNVYLVMLDLNKFKAINDTYGHAEGDRALKIAANVLQEVLSDGKVFFARIGGDEFAIIFRNSTDEIVQEKIIELRKLVAEKNEIYKLPYKIKFAIGYAVSTGEHYVDFAKLFTLADQKMYQDKAREIRVIPVAHAEQA